MSSTAATIVGRPFGIIPGQSYDLGGITFEAYVGIGDALPECCGVKMIYLDGRLTLVTTSRRHDWVAECIGDVVKAVASALDLEWETAGRATFRQKDLGGGVEGDQTFYFGENAVLMRGPVNVDLDVQPPPNLAIEVEVSHPADRVMLVWGRLGVPEVWRSDEQEWRPSYWNRRPDGTYEQVETSLFLPLLTTEDITSHLRSADSMGSRAWHRHLQNWARDVLVARRDGGE